MNRRGRFLLAVSAASTGLATACFLGGFRGVIYDSFHYITLSRIISSEGLWDLYSRYRTYGYPLFVSLVIGFRDTSDGTTRALVFAAQLLVYLAASFYAARVAERVFGSPRFFFGTYLALALNPIALIRTTELLSDLLSAVLLALALFVSLERSRPTRRAFLAFLALGLSIAVRPANLAVLPALAILWLFRGRLYGERMRQVLLPAAAALMLSLAPQLLSNVRAYDAWNPLLVDRLYANQVSWGMAILKYGTIVADGVEPQLEYRNPFYSPDMSSPREFLARKPGGYLKTLAMHGFGLVDQDHAFTYIQSARPWYRWPLSLLNYAFLFLALFGLAAGSGLSFVHSASGLSGQNPDLTPGGGSQGRREAAPRLYFAGAFLVSLAYVAIYLPVAVENRFSTPLYLVLAPAAVMGVDWLSRRRSGTVVAVAIAGGGFIAICVQLSLWLSRQAPALAALAALAGR